MTRTSPLRRKARACAQALAIRLHALKLFLENPVTARGAQRVELKREFLLGRRNSCITDPIDIHRACPLSRPAIIFSDLPLSSRRKAPPSL